MSDDNAQPEQPTTPQQQFNITKLYVKDVSFESPRVPELFANNTQWNPHVNLQLNTESRSIAEGLYEVVLSVTVTATIEEKTAYLVEVKQAGIFIVKGFDAPVRDNLLGSHCPNGLFPFAREVVSGLVSKAGFPVLMLEPINFETLYAQHLAKARQNAPAPTTPQ